MSSVPRPLIALLLGTIVFFGLWTFALKPSSSSGGPSGPHGLGRFQGPINQAHQVQGIVNGAAARDGGTPAPGSQGASGPAAAPSQPAPNSGPAPATTPAPAANAHTTPAAKAHTSAQPAPSVHHTPTPTGLPLVQRALDHHKVVALLFYNPASSDDRAVKQEFAHIPTHGGAVVKLTVSLQQVASYSDVLDQVPVNYSPTLVLIDRAQQAEEITGFADPFEIAQRVAGALASSPANQG